MGLTIRIKNYKRPIYDSGYFGFTRFRIALAKAYNQEFGELYEKHLNTLSSFIPSTLTPQEHARLLELSNPYLNIFLYHSDCDGKLTPTECKLIYEVTKNLECNYEASNYTTSLDENQLELFNEAFLYSWKHKVNIWFE